MKKGLLFIVVLVLLMIGGYYLYFVPVNYIGIDINPSIELATNRLKRVIEVLPLNDEADLLIADIKLKNLPYNEAIEKVIKEAGASGYLDDLAEDNVIVVSVAASNDDVAKTLENDLHNNIDKYLSNNKIPALILMEQNHEERKDLAKSYDISYGKLLLIQKLISLNPDLEMDELVDQPLRNIANQIGAARVEIVHNRARERQQTLAQQREQLKNEYQERREATIKGILDANDVPNEDRNQVRQEIIAKHKEKIMDAIDDTKETIEDNWGEIKDKPAPNIPPTIKEKVEKAKVRWGNQKDNKR